MPTVEEVLKASGLDDAAIAALDAKAKAGFTQILSTATQEREAAELERRKVADTFEKEINPALAKWGNESASLTAERDYYKTLADKAKEAGFAPAAEPFKAPASNPGRGDDGKFVAGAPGATPGSPTYMTKEEGYRAVTSAQWFISEYMRLNNGAPPPDDMESLAVQAQSERIPFRDFVAKKYDFAGKREAIKAADQKKHDDAIRKEESDRVTKEFTERMASGNPMIRQSETSKFSEIRKGVEEGKRPNPITQTREQRRQSTSRAIQHDIAENATIQ